MQKILCPRCEKVIRLEPRKTKFSRYNKKSRQLCDDCKNKGKTINIYCYRCKAVMETVPAKRSLNDRPSRTLCHNCKMISKKESIRRITQPHILENNRQRLLNNNPSKRSNKPKVIKLTRLEMSQRMKFNNPMHNQECVEKMKRTFNSRIKAGKIQYKKGPEHHLWKGNRGFNNSLRVFLYPIWTKKVLERDNFQCTQCGKKQNLQVHHLKPLRYFIKLIKDKYNIRSFAQINDKDWLQYFEEIAKLHKLEHGITVCKECHSLVDPYYRKRHED